MTQRARSRRRPASLTDDKDLKNEGKVDQATGTVKDKVGDAGDKVKDTFTRD